MSSAFEASAVLFDNDGVLVDSHPQVEQAWRQLADEFDLDGDALLQVLVGVRAADTLAKFLSPARCVEAVARLEDLEVELAGFTPPLAGASELIEALGDCRWTIVTSASRRLAIARWNGAGIDVPEHPVTADDVSKGKPDPEPFLAGAKVVGVDPAECVVFEDSRAGGEAARAAGATVIAVGDTAWEFEPAARIADLRAVEVRLPQGRVEQRAESFELIVHAS